MIYSFAQCAYILWRIFRSVLLVKSRNCQWDLFAKLMPFYSIKLCIFFFIKYSYIGKKSGSKSSPSSNRLLPFKNLYIKFFSFFLRKIRIKHISQRVKDAKMIQSLRKWFFLESTIIFKVKKSLIVNFFNLLKIILFFNLKALKQSNDFLTEIY